MTPPHPNSTKPYLIRAIFEWCVDQGFTPYVAVAVDARTEVPRNYIRDNQIVLNLSPDAVHQLVLGNEFLTCSARFGGVAQRISVPVENVVAVYARENGQGMAFEVGAAAAPANLDGGMQPGSAPESPPPSAPAPAAESAKPAGPAGPHKPGPGRPRLKRIK